MTQLNVKTIKGYHDTNPRSFKHIQNGTMYDKKGLIPVKRFIELFGGKDLPKEAYEGVIEGLLEPQPKSWINNPEFPNIWNYLMRDVCREEELMLLSFEIIQKDKAYVVERGHIERELYRKAKTGIAPTKEQMNTAYRNYWESRVPIFDYNGGFSLPQLCIWSPIETNRIKVEWTRPIEDLWKEINKK
jgi:hypothetical protein